MGVNHLVFTDTESAGFTNIVSNYLSSCVLTGSSYGKQCGKNHIRYPGYHELAYLHPKRFAPNTEILEELGLHQGDNYAIVRFVSWNAHHDVGLRGVSKENKLKLVKLLSTKLRVFISSEDELPVDLKPYQIMIKPEDMHSVMAFAHLFVGESATMASECACLGVPAIYIDNVGRGYTDHQQERYGLVFNYNESEHGQQQAILKAAELADRNHDDETYKVKRRLLLNDMIDVSQFMEWFVSNYPHSRRMMSNNGFNWEQFRTRN
jgi:predicted glycosyltransferase